KKVSGSWVDAPYYLRGTDTDTITSLPTIIYADGQSASAVIKGNMTQSGTPTPTNPIYPSETGDKTANLCEVTQSNSIYYANLNNYTISNNIITTTGNVLFGFIVKVDAETNYSVSSKTTAWVDMRIREYSAKPTSWENDFIIQSVNTPNTSYKSASFTTSSTTQYILVTLYSNISGIIISEVMLNTGSTALPYQPYGYKIPISSGGTTTPVYLGEVQSTRNIKKLVLTGQESWQITSNNKWLYFELADVPTRRISPISSHYTGSSTVSYANLADNSVTVSIYDNNQYRLALYDSRFTTVADFKTYLQQQYTNETPVTLWYVLGTPTTSTLNEPIRKIGDYADTVSGITIPTIAGADSFDVLTTLKPSEVTANYHGWHPVTDVHERGGGAWT
ncbi:MAG: hypothetical protein IKY44_05985, partial [Clostridia bacterium]|nr:hypothetical protein [Clostridia bacterium]